MGYEPASRNNSGCWMVLGNFMLMLTGGIILLALVVMIGFWRAGDRFFEGFDTMFNAPQPTPQVDVRSIVIRQIRGASELTTSVFAMEAVVPASRERTIAGFPVGSTTLLYIAYGEVRAGVDLAEIEAEDIEVISDTIYITLPPPRILDSKIDVNRSMVYDYDRGFLGLGPDVAPQLQSMAEQEALGKIVAAACANDILEEANEKAELAIARLLSTSGYSQVVVESRPPTADACPTP